MIKVGVADPFQISRVMNELTELTDDLPTLLGLTLLLTLATADLAQHHASNCHHCFLALDQTSDPQTQTGKSGLQGTDGV